MEDTYGKIKHTIQNVANDYYSSAKHAGIVGDGGQSILLTNLKFWCLGIDWVETDEDEFVDIPKDWEQHFVVVDPEYEEYMRLKEKFED